MIFRETTVAGVLVIDIQPVEDRRGFFARAWDPEILAEHGLDTRIAQCSLSYNAKKGTLRGMHYQAAPHQETKVVRCIAGAIYDVVLDVREGTQGYGQWDAVELSASNRRALYIPHGVAHGFVTLEDACELYYIISERHHPESARGVRWNDPAFGIRWPVSDPIMSDADRNRPATGASV